MVDPLKSLCIVIHLIQGRLFLIEVPESLHIIFKLLMIRLFQKLPVKASLLRPLSLLGKLLSHEQQLLAGMNSHKSIGSTEIRELLLLVTRHFHKKGAF